MELLDFINEHQRVIINVMMACAATVTILASIVSAMNYGKSRDALFVLRMVLCAHMTAFSLFTLWYRNVHANGRPSVVVSMWAALLILHVAGHNLGVGLSFISNRDKNSPGVL